MSDREALRLLYVEDNRLNAILFEEALRSRPDTELRLAVDGADAVHQLLDWLPDLLVLDANLPDMDGFELLRLLRQQSRLAQLPAVMCSADAGSDDVAKALAAGFAGFWPKPIDIGQILLDLDRFGAERGKS